MLNNDSCHFNFNIWFNTKKVIHFYFDEICYIISDKNRSKNRGQTVVRKESKCN